MSAYPSRQEFFTFGLPAKAFVAAPRVVASVDAAADVLVVPGHGLSDGDRVRVGANPGGGGLPDGVLPAGLSPSVVYYVAGSDLGTDLLQLSLTEGGAAVDMTDVGSPVFSLFVDIGSRIDAGLEAISRHGDQHLKAHSTPLATAPVQFRMWLCEILAFKLAVSSGLVDPQYAKDPALAARAKDAQGQLDDLAKGQLLDGAEDATPAIVEDGAVAWGEADRFWSPCGVL